MKLISVSIDFEKYKKYKKYAPYAIKGLAVVAVCTVFGFAVRFAADRPEKALPDGAAELRAAAEAEQNGDPATAAVNFAAAAEKGYRVEDAVRHAVECYLEAGDPSKAEEIAALADDELLGELYCRISSKYAENGDYFEAVRMIEFAIEMGNPSENARYYRAEYLRAAGEFDAAVVAYDEAIGAGERIVEAHWGRAVCLVTEQKFEDALDDLRAVALSDSDLSDRARETLDEVEALLGK